MVTAGQHDVVAPTADNLLTLITSNGGLAPNGRLAVQAKLVGKPVAVPGSVVSSSPAASSDWAVTVPPVDWPSCGHWPPSSSWSGAALAVWRWRRPVLIYVFAAPIVVACGLLACESLARALPATF